MDDRGQKISTLTWKQMKSERHYTPLDKFYINKSRLFFTRMVKGLLYIRLDKMNHRLIFSQKFVLCCEIFHISIFQRDDSKDSRISKLFIKLILLHHLPNSSQKKCNSIEEKMPCYIRELLTQLNFYTCKHFCL